MLRGARSMLEDAGEEKDAHAAHTMVCLAICAAYRALPPLVRPKAANMVQSLALKDAGEALAAMELPTGRPAEDAAP